MTDPVSATASRAISASGTPGPTRDAALQEVARDLEAAFLEEMLKHAGFGAARGSFGGGAGEAQFASLLRTEHARAMTERGGIGLSEAIFRALVARAAAPDQPG